MFGCFEVRLDDDCSRLSTSGANLVGDTTNSKYGFIGFMRDNNAAFSVGLSV